MTLETDLSNLTLVVKFLITTFVDVLSLFTVFPLNIILAGVALTMCFGLVRKFIRTKK